MSNFLNKVENKLVKKEEVKDRENILKEIKEKNLDIVKIEEISKTLNKENINDFGITVQSKLGTVSSTLLETVKNGDTGEIGKDLIELIDILDKNNPEKLFNKEKSFFARLFGRVKNNIDLRIKEHENIQRQVDTIKNKLEDGIKILENDNSLLEKQYENSMLYIMEIENFIKGGELKLLEGKEELKALETKIDNEKDNIFALEEYNEENNFLNRLDKRIFDLSASKMTVIQQLPQIRVIAESNNLLKDRIRNAIDLAIPVWTDLITNQLVLLRQQKLLEQVNEINSAVDKALEENSKLFKDNVLKAVKENERGIVDISRIKATHLNTIETLREALKVQEESRKEREREKLQIKELEKELQKTLVIENEGKRIAIEG